MKIGIIGLDVPEGKVKFKDDILIELEQKFEPKKVTPFFFEFIMGEEKFVHCDALAVYQENMLDLLIHDIEKLETRLERGAIEAEKDLLERCLPFLEDEKPACDLELSDEERVIMTALAPLSFKPTLVVEEKSPDINQLIRTVMDKANVSFFYTAGKPEVHAWFIEKGSDIVTCSGKIHTDLARGFIKAEIVHYTDYRTAHNLQDARKQGLSKLVDRDYIIQEGDVIDIRFNV